MADVVSQISSSSPVRLFFTLYFYILVSSGFLAILILQVLFGLFFFPLIICIPGFRQTLLGSICQLVNAIVFILCFFWRVEITRPQREASKTRKTIYVCNHTSSLDSWIISYILAPNWPQYVVKSSLFTLPLAGWCLWLAGYPSIRFTKDKGGWGTEKSHIKKTMAETKILMESGHNLMVYPEGTRSVSGRLQPFKIGFFKFAIENGYDIIPIAMHNNPNLWPLKGFLVKSGKSYVAFGDSIKPQGKTVEELRDETREAMFNLLKLSPLFDDQKDQPLEDMATTRGHGL